MINIMVMVNYKEIMAMYMMDSGSKIKFKEKVFLPVKMVMSMMANG